MHQLEQLGQDVRYAWRSVRSQRLLTATVVATLALGVAATTTIFSLVDALMLRMLPGRHPEQLVELFSRYPGEPRFNGFDWRVYEHFRDHNEVFAGMAGISPARLSLRLNGGASEIVDGEYVSGNLFSLLGLAPAAGRLIEHGDDHIGSPSAAVAVVSWSFWNGRLDRDPAAIGKQVVVEGATVTVVGVAPREFSGLQVGARPVIWLPAAAEAIAHRPSRRLDGTLGMKLLARLRPGIDITRANAHMAILDQWRVAYLIDKQRAPLLRDLRLELAPAGAGFAVLRDTYATPLFLLGGLAGVLLLVACSNVATILLARGTARRREFAIQLALGSSRGRLLRRMVAESLLLSGMATALGALLASAVIGSVVAIVRSGRGLVGLPGPIEIDVVLDIRVLAFVIVTGGLTTLACATMPVWSVCLGARPASLREIGRASEGGHWRLVGNALVVCQVALSLVLLTAAVLFARHLAAIGERDLGFARESVLLVTLDPRDSALPPDRLAEAYERLLGRFEEIESVRSATLAAMTPIEGPGAASLVTVEGVTKTPDERRYVAVVRVAPKYFETFGVRSIAGRDFTFGEVSATPAAIVNERMARRYFGEADPIGRRLSLDGQSTPFEIVGVVGDAKHRDVRVDAPEIVYLNAFQAGRGTSSRFALRTTVPPASVAGEVRRLVNDELRSVSITRITSLDDQVDASLVPERLVSAFSRMFGGVGAVLAALGLYGLLTYTVSRRVHELGIRMALGATTRAVERMVLGGAMVMVTLGVLVAVPIVGVGGRVLAPLRRGSATDVLTPFAMATVLTLVVAAVAAYVPAWRAGRLDPMRALREE